MEWQAEVGQGPRGRTMYMRPTLDPELEDLGIKYRDACNRTGRCPGCDVEVQVVHGNDGIHHVNFRHDDACPVIVSQHRAIRRNHPKVGRNDPCVCGSGKKLKHCHGSNTTREAE